jgi:hypothetical protein
MKSKSFALIAAAALFIASNVFAAENGPRTAVIPNFAAPPAAVTPDASGGLYLTDVTTGYSASGIPCYECQSFTGTPTVNVTVTMGSTTIFTGSVTFTSALGPGYVAYADFPFTLPSTRGEASIAVTVTDGSTGLAKGKSKFRIY